jgi:hypothetical protein
VRLIPPHTTRIGALLLDLLPTIDSWRDHGLLDPLQSGLAGKGGELSSFKTKISRLGRRGDWRSGDDR